MDSTQARMRCQQKYVAPPSLAVVCPIKTPSCPGNLLEPVQNLSHDESDDNEQTVYSTYRYPRKS